MKYLALFFVLLFFIPVKTSAQDIEIYFHETTLYDTIGAEIVFEFEIKNISALPQEIFLLRTIDDLPANWSSSLCVGVNCFPSIFDSIATTPDFALSPVQPGDTLEASLHVFAETNEGTANVQLQIGTLHSPDVRTTQDFVAHATPVAVEDDEFHPGGFFLAQNYPNPFNPSTKIKYGLKEAGMVSLKIFDVLGNEVAELINEYIPAGIYETNFNSSQLTSGIYIYRLVTGKYSETRKMILEK